MVTIQSKLTVQTDLIIKPRDDDVKVIACCELQCGSFRFKFRSPPHISYGVFFPFNKTVPYVTHAAP